MAPLHDPHRPDADRLQRALLRAAPTTTPRATAAGLLAHLALVLASVAAVVFIVFSAPSP